MRRLAWIAAIVTASTGLARADEPRAGAERSSSLSWVRLEGAEECIGGSALARAIEERLDRHIFVSAASADVLVEGRAERVASPPGFRAIVTITDRSGASLGERVVDAEGASCTHLGELVTVAIALMIDPLVPAPEPAPPERTRVIVRTKRVVVPAPAPWHFETDGSLGVGLGVLPGVAPGGLGALVVQPPGFVPLVLEGALFLGQSDRARLIEAVGGIAICPLARRGDRLGFALCAGIDGGGLFASARDPGVPDGDRLVAQARLSLRGHWRIVGPLALRAGLHGVVPFRHDELAVTDQQGDRRVLYFPDVVAGIVTLGVGLVFR
jgi:hypothetical protein